MAIFTLPWQGWSRMKAFRCALCCLVVAIPALAAGSEMGMGSGSSLYAFTPKLTVEEKEARPSPVGKKEDYQDSYEQYKPHNFEAEEDDEEIKTVDKIVGNSDWLGPKDCCACTPYWTGGVSHSALGIEHIITMHHPRYFPFDYSGSGSGSGSGKGKAAFLELENPKRPETEYRRQGQCAEQRAPAEDVFSALIVAYLQAHPEETGAGVKPNFKHLMQFFASRHPPPSVIKLLGVYTRRHLDKLPAPANETKMGVDSVMMSALACGVNALGVSLPAMLKEEPANFLETGEEKKFMGIAIPALPPMPALPALPALPDLAALGAALTAFASFAPPAMAPLSPWESAKPPDTDPPEPPPSPIPMVWAKKMGGAGDGKDLLAGEEDGRGIPGSGSDIWGGYKEELPAVYPAGNENNKGGAEATWPAGSAQSRGEVKKTGSSIGFPYAPDKKTFDAMVKEMMPKVLATSIEDAAKNGWCCKCLKAWALPEKSVTAWVRGMYTDTAYSKDQLDIKGETGKEFHQTGIKEFPFDTYLPTTKSALENPRLSKEEMKTAPEHPEPPKGQAGDEGAGLMGIAPDQGGD